MSERQSWPSARTGSTRWATTTTARRTTKMRRGQRTPRRPGVDRETAIAAAIRDGKIDGARADEYRRMWDANPGIIRRLLTARVEDGGLMPGLVRAEQM